MGRSSVAVKSRARSEPVSPEVKRERVWHVVEMMIRGEFVRGDTARELAEEWGIALDTAQGICAEASRTADIVVNSREALVNTARLALVKIIQENGADRVPALRTLFEHMGELKQEKRVKMSVSQELPEDYEQRLVEALGSKLQLGGKK